MTQEQALQILKTGANVFLTGEPGSGKTYTINQYVSWLRQNSVYPAITASTGIAATHINGSTLHSWSGIGIRNTASDYEIEQIASNPKVATRIQKASVLIVDEISMLPGTTLDIVERVCRKIRGGGVFGDLQVVLIGDFFQLPPVTSSGQLPDFAFNSRVWQEIKPVVCYLEEQYRQTDTDYLGLLSAIRSNSFDEMHFELLESRRAASGNATDITRLYTHNLDVDRVNSLELAKLPGPTKRFTMLTKGASVLVEQLKRGCLSPEQLELKVGAKVMFTKNSLEKKYVNGTTGVVTGFVEGSGLPQIKTREGKTLTVDVDEWKLEENKKVRATITQLPLRLAWSITVHKSQGMSLDAAEINLSNSFEYGQGYVALSRIRSLEGLHITGYNAKALQVHPHVAEQDSHFHNQSSANKNSLSQSNPADLEKQYRDFIEGLGGLWSEEPVDAEVPKVKQSTHSQTRELIQQQKTLEDIASLRSLKVETIISHLEDMLKRGEISIFEVSYLKPNDPVTEVLVKTAFKELATDKLKPVFDHLQGDISYATIRLYKLFI